MKTVSNDAQPGSSWVVVLNSSEPWDDYVHTHPVGSFQTEKEAKDFIEAQQNADNKAMEALGDMGEFIQKISWYNIDEVPFMKKQGELQTIYTIYTTRNETGDREITDVSYDHVPAHRMEKEPHYKVLLDNPNKAFQETPEGHVSSDIFPPLMVDETGKWFTNPDEIFSTLSPASLKLKAPEGYAVPALKPLEPRSSRF